MKKVTLISSIIIVILVFSILRITSCNKSDIITDNTNFSTRYQNYSGLDIFKGIHFNEGAVADIFKIEDNSIFNIKQELTQEQQEVKKDLMKDIISNINILKPNFFDEYKNEMYSEDYNVIQKSLNNANFLIYKLV